jgi:hypothetical protein
VNHHDDSSNSKPEQVDSPTTEEKPTAPRKIMLGKRVLRHFHVKSGVKTGLIAGDGITDNAKTRCVVA